MAKVPYDHVEAPCRITGPDIDFNTGDPIPVDTAKRIGLLGGPKARKGQKPLDVIPAYEPDTEGVVFQDEVIEAPKPSGAPATT